jgi:hypothetical protein
LERTVIGMQRVVYMLDRGIKGVTGLSPALVPKAMEWPQIGAPSQVLGRLRIEYGNPCQLHSPPAENTRNEVGEVALLHAPILEDEIAAIVAMAGDSLRQNGRGDRSAAQGVRRPAGNPPKADGNPATSSKNVGIRVNEVRRERAAIDPDIRIDEPDRAAQAVRSPRARTASTVVAALLAALGIGWIVGVPSSVVDRFAALVDKLAFMPPAQKGNASGQPGDSKKQIALGGTGTNRGPNPGILDTNKNTGVSIARGHRPGYMRNPGQSNVIKTSAAAQQNARPSELITSNVGRRPKFSPEPILTPESKPTAPFPETKPATIDGWVVRDVYGGTAVLEGPDGIWNAARGDMVPHVGRIDSIVRWGSRWIVVTSSGLISSP